MDTVAAVERDAECRRFNPGPGAVRESDEQFFAKFKIGWFLTVAVQNLYIGDIRLTRSPTIVTLFSYCRRDFRAGIIELAFLPLLIVAIIGIRKVLVNYNGGITVGFDMAVP